MRYSRTDLLQLKDYHLVIDENISFTEKIAKQFSRIRKINEMNVTADGTYDPVSEQLLIHLEVKGSVIVG
ncbi:MAG TPA: hypothetical protein PLI19_06945, partial [Erysipelotrichaceae bacterium]|nr:hypothetical protein [Erysipelotrichaceae bacterium]